MSFIYYEQIQPVASLLGILREGEDVEKGEDSKRGGEDSIMENKGSIRAREGSMSGGGGKAS